MTTDVQPRKPKRADYTKVALAAAQASLKAQTAAHVAVLAAADDVEDAHAALTAAQQKLDAAETGHTTAIAEMVALIGAPETATRLELPEAKVKAAVKAAPARDDAGQPTS